MMAFQKAKTDLSIILAHSWYLRMPDTNAKDYLRGRMRSPFHIQTAARSIELASLDHFNHLGKKGHIKQSQDKFLIIIITLTQEHAITISTCMCQLIWSAEITSPSQTGSLYIQQILPPTLIRFSIVEQKNVTCPAPCLKTFRSLWKHEILETPIQIIRCVLFKGLLDSISMFFRRF